MKSSLCLQVSLVSVFIQLPFSCRLPDMASSLLLLCLRIFSSSLMVKVEVLQLTVEIYLKSYAHSFLYCAINIKKDLGESHGG